MISGKGFVIAVVLLFAKTITRESFKAGVTSPALSTLNTPKPFFKKLNSVTLVPSLVQYEKIDGDLVDALKEGETPGALIYFNGVDSVIETVQSAAHSTLQEKRTAFVQSLKLNAEKEQGTAKSALKLLRVHNYYSSFAENCIVIEKVSLDVIVVLSKLQPVTRIEKAPLITLNSLLFDEPGLQLFGNQSVLNESFGKTTEDSIFPNWGTQRIDVPEVWRLYTKGQGVIIANIDTGVRVSHEALRDNWRKDNGWFDPYGKYEQPVDESGHGTHIMGTLVGRTKNVGILPLAEWISCRGCQTSKVCGPSQQLQCGDWILNLTAIGKGADVVSISFGWRTSRHVSDFYRNTIKCWNTAGIHSAFAIGNFGPACSSGKSPANQEATFSVGSIEEDGSLSLSSSIGPETEKIEGQRKAAYIKPDVVAPGGNIYSAWHTADADYKSISGTSMSVPHVAAIMGLLLSYARSNGFQNLEPDYVTDLIKDTAVNTGLSLPRNASSKICAAPRYLNVDPENVFPNCYFGWGLANALNVIEQFKKDFKID